MSKATFLLILWRKHSIIFPWFSCLSMFIYSGRNCIVFGFDLSFSGQKRQCKAMKEKNSKKKKMMGENLWWSNTIRVSGFIHRHLIYIYDQSLEGNIGNCKLKRTGMVVHLLIMYLHSPMTLTVFLTSFPLSRCISVLSHQWLVSPSWFHSSYLPQIHYHHSPSLLSLFSFDYFILYTLWSIFF